MQDEYLSIQNLSTGDFRDRGSKFLAYATPVIDEDQVKVFIQSLWKEHPKARHICYAFVLGPEEKLQRANDDGEPSGTAGLPILNTIRSFELQRVLLAVVRYFGGTKLGTSGLIHAYKMSSQEALNNAIVIRKFLTQDIKLSFSYKIMGPLLNILKKEGIPILNKTLDENPYVIIQLKKSQTRDSIRQIKAQLLNKSLEEIGDKTKVPGFNTEMLHNA